MTRSQTALVAEYLGVAFSMAIKFSKKQPEVDEDGLRSAAQWGLVQAAIRWQRQGDFLPFATSTIRGELLNEARKFKRSQKYHVPLSDAHHLTATWRDRQPIDRLIMIEEIAWLTVRLAWLTPAQRGAIDQQLSGQPCNRFSLCKAIKRLRPSAPR